MIKVDKETYLAIKKIADYGYYSVRMPVIYILRSFAFKYSVNITNKPWLDLTNWHLGVTNNEDYG